MPTGYTSRIADGIDFKTFVMDCARAFGACVMLPGGGEKIPKKFEPDPYYLNRLNDLKHELEIFDKKYTDEYCERMVEEEYNEQVESNKRRNEKVADLEKKYRVMLANVNNWDPPTEDHIALKNFMIQQITDSIKFDCHYYPEDNYPKRDVEQWKQDKLNAIKKDIAYYQAKYDKECERIERNNKWISDLRGSLNV